MVVEAHGYKPRYWLAPSLLGRADPDPMLVDTGALDYLPAQCRRIEMGGFDTRAGHRIPIPDGLAARLERPTPLHRARCLETKFATGTRIFLKREDQAPSGSLKYGAAIAGCYFAGQDGAHEVVACSMAGNFAVAVALAAAELGLRSRILMSRDALIHRSNLVSLAEEFGAKIVPTDVGTGDMGAVLFAAAVDDVRRRSGARLILGCHGNHAAAFQSVIGIEAAGQLHAADERVDLVVGSTSGGTSIAGLMLGFAEGGLPGGLGFVLAENAEFAELAGHDGHRNRPSVYCGLNTRCRVPIVRSLFERGEVRAVGITPDQARSAAVMLEDLEGISCADETAYAVAAALGELKAHSAVMICVSGGPGDRAADQDKKRGRQLVGA